jgi:catechol 2,3-dioxygenase-like lactoylglutathione lyase family enzyme
MLVAEPTGGTVMAPPRILGLDHVVLRVTDLERARAFYCEVLGATVERWQEEPGLLQLRIGASMIDLVPLDGKLGGEHGRPPGREGINMHHYCVRIEPFDEAALRTHLALHRIDPGEVVPRFGAEGRGPSMYIADPDGNTVELKGPPFPEQ